MNRLIEVVSPAPSKDLVTKARVVAELGVSETIHDDSIEAMISQASRAVANYCGREFIAEGIRETWRPIWTDSASITNNPTFVYLRRLPVVTVTSYLEDGVALLEGIDYELQRDTGRLLRLNNDTPAVFVFRKTVIEYTGGYSPPGATITTGDPPALEPDLERAAIEVFKLQWFGRKRDPSIAAEAVPGLFSATYRQSTNSAVGGPDYPPAIAALLAPWRGLSF